MDISQLEKWSQKDQVFIDVRSPGEFQQGHIPGALNAPILNDEERALIGLTYKQKGQAEAVRLGHEIVSGENKKRKLETWKNILSQHPDAILMCFRGGQRSQITQSWLRAEGLDRPLVPGGYKALRQALIVKMETFSQSYPFLLVSGATGAGKTAFLQEASHFWPTLHLEKYAEHRGSAFGGYGREQPSQANFENRLAWDILKCESELKISGLPVLMEDESRLIGRSVLPELFFSKMRISSILWLDTPLDERVQNTFLEYVEKESVSEELFSRYKKALFNIQRRLGGKEYQEILSILENCESAWKENGELEGNKVWIERLLLRYYDPLYFGSLQKRNPQVAFRGGTQEAFDFLKGQKRMTSEQAVKKKASPT